MSRGEYLERYGHRGPHEWEVSRAQPAEDPEWLDRQLAEFHASPVDVEALLREQRTRYQAAWERFQERYPKRAAKMGRRIEKFAAEARLRETVRSEVTRMPGLARAYALQAGALTGLGEDAFFLTFKELVTLLEGDRGVAAAVPARKETYARQCALPPYPAFINGRFDPVTWAADPHRRSDIYDAHAPAPVLDSDTLTGFPGASGRVEGRVRVLASAEESHELEAGEILVATTTNVGWTPLFPRAAAIITDIGAPLSHAAIVARELGIPAVVGCGDATMRLRTGDRVLVDGGQGVVHLLPRD
jgi:phosphohistidine swiveling domain-containing protein